MARILRGVVPLLLCCVLLSGCWDYRGLNELTIVTGIAIDLGEDGEGYSLTFEIVDMTSETESEYNSTLLATEGRTVAEAVYNASVKLHNDMYLGNAEVVLISRPVAEDVGLHTLLDYLLRDQNTRDNLHIVVTDTDTAAELLVPTGEERGGIVSFTLSESLDQHEGNNSNSTNAVEIYEIYNILILDTSSLALPLVAPAEDEPFQLEGMALFTGDKMTGQLREEDMTFYLLAKNSLQGGGYPVELAGEEGRGAVLANRKSSPGIRFSREGDTLHFVVDIRIFADVIEFSQGWDKLDGAAIRELEAAAGRSLAGSVEEVIGGLRDEGYDVLGLQEALRNRDFTLWSEIAEDWDDWFARCEITATARVTIDNTGMIEQYGGTGE